MLQPLFTMIIFTFFFGRLVAIPSDGVRYPLPRTRPCCCGLISPSSSLVGNSLILNSSLITKIYFPRVLMPGAAALGGLLHLLVSSVFLVAVRIYYRAAVHWNILLTPLSVAETVLLVLGAGMLLAGLKVRFRDVKCGIPFLTQIGLFVTPGELSAASISGCRHSIRWQV